MFSCYSKSPEDTHQIANIVTDYLVSISARQGVSGLSLSGTLGAGKTEFVKGVATALGIKESIASPSFVLECQYDCNHDVIRTLHHWDFYRLNDSVEELEITEELENQTALVVVEWAEKIPWIQDRLALEVLLEIEEVAGTDNSQISTRRNISIKSSDIELQKQLCNFIK
jgi:tRNA threonylcarbamoyladenosine biosynthesis protein TsaE